MTADWAGMFGAGRSTSSVSDTVDGHPFGGTVPTSNGYRSGNVGQTHCILIDESSIVTDVKVWGDASARKKFS